MKCSSCGLEHVLMTWRTPLEAAEAFGIPREGREAEVLLRAPTASQVTCPECGLRGRSHLIFQRQARGPICSREL